MDELDLSIISLLTNEGRIHNTVIARQTGVSEETIRRRKALLMQQGVFHVSAVPDVAKLGYRSEVLVAIALRPTEVENVADALAGLDEVTRVAIVTGRFDIMAWITLRSLAEMDSFLRDKVRPIPGVDRPTAFVFLEVVKPWTPRGP